MNDVKHAAWHKSSHSSQEGGTCVELADLNTTIAVRDSTDPTGPILQFDRPAIIGLIGRIKASDLEG